MDHRQYNFSKLVPTLFCVEINILFLLLVLNNDKFLLPIFLMDDASPCGSLL